ncbi:nuclear transcription factor Y subunit B-3-like [Pyrus ussuriensis x Pyrus communis]|uniref:Nuclear transcription factor Y subunit B-3-like n=1 Tax=Pyrus ussuriensis x Pyrus communis TaxID=2448454 RepID=A0A5N5GB13_9ROSA|nr:nuclear transcription factor Y subunit B-3-like [Pyrus ussuriensis x Pyrus communis]
MTIIRRKNRHHKYIFVCFVPCNFVLGNLELKLQQPPEESQNKQWLACQFHIRSFKVPHPNPTTQNPPPNPQLIEKQTVQKNPRLSSGFVITPPDPTDPNFSLSLPPRPYDEAI